MTIAEIRKWAFLYEPGLVVETHNPSSPEAKGRKTIVRGLLVHRVKSRIA